jgi:hypothetical protein
MTPKSFVVRHRSTWVRPVLIAAGWLVAGLAHANSFTATIESLQLDSGSNAGYVRLTGQPTFDGGGCTNYWARGALDDERFMVYFWPALMSAKNHGFSVTVFVNGCQGGYPLITVVQVNAT